MIATVFLLLSCIHFVIIIGMLYYYYKYNFYVTIPVTHLCLEIELVKLKWKGSW
jgi:hypothetical protein